MNINTFISSFAETFDLCIHDLSLHTEFKQLPFWTSMQALILIASIEDNYGVTLSALDLSESKTIEDLYNIIKLNNGNI